jgi:parvulin-like peptidyl-prolyl isomerase
LFRLHDIHCRSFAEEKIMRRLSFVLCACGLATFPTIARGQAEKVRAELVAIGALKAPGIVAANVDGKPIDVAEVNRLVKLTLRNRPASKAALPGLEAQALEQVIHRRLVNLFLDSKKVTVTDAEIDKVIADREKQYKKQDADLADVRAQSGLTQATYRDEVEWELRWGKYLRGLLTDEKVEKFFEAHRQEYDGTELRVSHILLRPDGPLTPEQIDVLVARAETIRDEILGGLTEFEEAAKKYSSGPSRQHGGDIGYISRHGIMPEDFTQAAFELEKDEISAPVLSRLGVHLIQCTEIRPGKKTWRDVRKELQPAVMQETFEKVAEQMRKTATIEYTGDVAHLNVETGEVVRPTEAPKTE